ncbi:hypothetical protein QFZ78_003754 [Paenibacillus sp. V4I5]|nr:hypothetical protein [Paenibacillus sp. V4I5]
MNKPKREKKPKQLRAAEKAIFVVLYTKNFVLE